jgi:putative ABC transport system permease protein
MLKHHLLVTLRTLRRQKGYAAINVLGLAVGIACCLLIGLYVREEKGYDRFHEDAESIYRVNWDFDWRGNAGVAPGTPPPLAAAFTAEIPGVEAATRLYPVAGTTVRHGDTSFDEDAILAADSNFFSFFSFNLVAGDPRTALAAPNSVVLTESAAQRYFGDAPALGRGLQIGEAKEVLGRPYDEVFRVTGVVADPPAASHIQFDLLTSMTSHPEVAFFDWSWVWMQVVTYVKVPPGTPAAAVEADARAVVATHAPAAFERIGFSYDELVTSGGRWAFVLQPLTEVYLGSAGIGNRVGPAGNGAAVLLFAVIAVFVLLIACVNFMNLATARAARRAKEVGVRKVLGSQRRTLLGQFLVEALVLSGLALPVAFLLVQGAVGPFNELSGKALDVHLFEPVWLPVALVLIVGVVGLLAGSYPALYLSSFPPIEALRGAFTPGGRSRWSRHVLVVFQFVLSIGLIAGTLIVHRQMDFVQHADLGFDQDNVVVISNENDRLRGQAAAFTERIEEHTAVRSAAVSTGVPPTYGFEDFYRAEGHGDEQLSLISYMTDEDFLPTLGITLVEGRGFSDARASDAHSVIVNEAAVEAFGWDDPIGQTIEYPSQGRYEVIGVMEDFHFLTLRSPIQPFALFHHSSESYQIPDSYVVVRLAAGDLESGLGVLAAEWERFAPDTPFAYSFLDARLGEQYRAERRLGDLFSVFAGLTIFIACLGLLGLAAHAAERRTKEIGVRKVLGASVPALVALLSKDFVRLVLVGFLVATPIAYLGAQRWLDGFAYRTEIGLGVFVIAGLVALVIALATVGFHAVRAATGDPVESLRTE